jgi:hypothetical protein
MSGQMSINPPTDRLRSPDWVEQARSGASIRPAPRLIHLKQLRRFGRAPAAVAIHPTPDIRLRRTPRQRSLYPHVWTAPSWQGLFFTYAALVGAPMCSAFKRGSHDRWP